MNRKQLEHVLRASGSICGCRGLVVVGSQAILGAHPDAPRELCMSMEADVYPVDDPQKADLIDGCIGELSPFHETFGYYAHGVGPETATLPSGWMKRAVRVENENTGGITGLCLAPVDLAISKLVAGRTKDTLFVRCMLANHLVDERAIRETLRELPDTAANLVRNRLAGAIIPE